MKRALADTRLPPDAIDDVNAHTTSPSAGDAAETNGVKHVFRHQCCDISID